ncbi:hypothetical protein ElyMa_000225700 [Elysia marginata]|uniref:Uncharacterized protein n=1 Tax=Elysia marginata TaxID=1093978 RepID=A0AAV4F012_9GAST|nr:hypothetical protein ElyMa_000225700 [Elysia marginata]
MSYGLARGDEAHSRGDPRWLMSYWVVVVVIVVIVVVVVVVVVVVIVVRLTLGFRTATSRGRVLRLASPPVDIHEMSTRLGPVNDRIRMLAESAVTEPMQGA